MQEKANLNVHPQRTQHLRKKHQVVIVNPDRVSWLSMSRNHICELSVDRPVALKLARIQNATRWEVVEQRPQRIVRVAVVVVGIQLRIEVDWHQSAGDKLSVGIRVRLDSGITNPHRVRFILQRLQRRNQPTDGVRQRLLPCRSILPYRYGQAVRYENRAGHIS